MHKTTKCIKWQPQMQNQEMHKKWNTWKCTKQDSGFREGRTRVVKRATLCNLPDIILINQKTQNKPVQRGENESINNMTPLLWISPSFETETKTIKFTTNKNSMRGEPPHISSYLLSCNSPLCISPTSLNYHKALLHSKRVLVKNVISAKWSKCANWKTQKMHKTVNHKMSKS